MKAFPTVDDILFILDYLGDGVEYRDKKIIIRIYPDDAYIEVYLDFGWFKKIKVYEADMLEDTIYLNRPGKWHKYITHLYSLAERVKKEKDKQQDLEFLPVIDDNLFRDI